MAGPLVGAGGRGEVSMNTLHSTSYISRGVQGYLNIELANEQLAETSRDRKK